MRPIPQANFTLAVLGSVGLVVGFIAKTPLLFATSAAVCVLALTGEVVYERFYLYRD